MSSSRTTTPSRSTPDGYPEEWLDLISEARRRGHLSLFDERIRYHCAHATEQSFSDPEEMVRAGLYSWLVLRREYPPDAIRIEARVPRRTPHDYADLVVYTDSTCRTPYLVVETKAPGQSDAAFRQAVEQVFGYANSLRDTAIALVDAGDRSVLYSVAGHPHDERRANRLGTRRAVPVSYDSISRFQRIAGDPDHDIAPCSTTGHSNRRRTQEADFFDLVVPLPELALQVRVADQIAAVKRRRDRADAELRRRLHALDRAMGANLGLDALREMVDPSL